MFSQNQSDVNTRAVYEWQVQYTSTLVGITQTKKYYFDTQTMQKTFVQHNGCVYLDLNGEKKIKRNLPLDVDQHGRSS